MNNIPAFCRSFKTYKHCDCCMLELGYKKGGQAVKNYTVKRCKRCGKYNQVSPAYFWSRNG